MLLRKSKTASVNLLSDISSFTDVFPGLLFHFIPPSSTPNTSPSFLYVRHCSVPCQLRDFSDSFYSSLTSFFHTMQSLNKCSLVCLFEQYHQHKSELLHPNFSLTKGAINACPDASWKKRDASSFGDLLSSSGILWTSPSARTLKDWFPLSLLMMSSLHSLLAPLLIEGSRKARLATSFLCPTVSPLVLLLMSSRCVLWASPTARQPP